MFTCTGLTNLPSTLSSPVLLHGSSVVSNENWAPVSSGTFSRVNSIVVSFNIWNANKENKSGQLASRAPLTICAIKESSTKRINKHICQIPTFASVQRLKEVMTRELWFLLTVPVVCGQGAAGRFPPKSPLQNQVTHVY